MRDHALLHVGVENATVHQRSDGPSSSSGQFIILGEPRLILFLMLIDAPDLHRLPSSRRPGERPQVGPGLEIPDKATKKDWPRGRSSMGEPLGEKVRSGADRFAITGRPRRRRPRQPRGRPRQAARAPAHVGCSRTFNSAACTGRRLRGRQSSRRNRTCRFAWPPPPLRRGRPLCLREATPRSSAASGRAAA